MYGAKLSQQNLDAFYGYRKKKTKQRVKHTCPQLSFLFYVSQDSTSRNSVLVFKDWSSDLN